MNTSQIEKVGMVTNMETSNQPKQYDFSRNWRKRIVPLLECRDVVRALTVGMMLGDGDFHEGDPPWEFGRGPLNGQRARQGCLSWYQPWGRCHYIAPFSWALGKRLLPALEWGFITSHRHTVVIGWTGDWREPQWIMDILLFRKKSAEESLTFARSDDWRFYRSLETYAASFYYDPESALELYRGALRSRDGMIPGNVAAAPVGEEIAAIKDGG